MKRFVTLMWVILISIMNYAQTPQVSIPITINDGAGGSQVLYFGLDPAATDGIDVGLGEAVLPPLPPTGVFDARLNLPNGTESSLRDYRQGSNSYSGSKDYTIQYQVGSGTEINLIWNFVPGISGRLQDIVLGNLIDVNMNGSGSYKVSNPGVFVKLKMTITYTPPTLNLPANGATNQWLTTTFTWNSVTNATKYGLYVATNSDFSNIVFSDTTITGTSKTLATALNTYTVYYWRIIGISENGRAIYSETRSFTTAKPIFWANLQWPDQATIEVGGSMTAYAQIWIDGITAGAGPGSGISAWIGYSTSNTNPNTWTNWVPATYNVNVGDNDEYMASIGSDLPAGTYYFASRFQFAGGAYYYGGFNNGEWNGTTNISGVLTVTTPLPGIPNPLTPGNGSTGIGISPMFIWNTAANATLYRLQIATDAGFSNIVFNDSTITDSTYTLTTELNYNTQYFWRIKAKNAAGTSDFSGTQSFTTVRGIGWANLQFPPSAEISVGGNATFYARVYVSGITEPAGQGSNIEGWIGYSTTNTDPSTWTDWVPATYNADYDNNDEYMATFGSTLPAGTYYVASKFRYLSTEGGPPNKYGGYSEGGGGFWDGVNNISSVLTVTSAVPPAAPTLVSPVNGATAQSTLPTLEWNASSGATSYRLIIATDAEFSDIVYNDSTITDTSKTLTSALQNYKTYYWKVSAKSAGGTSAYSVAWNFRTIAVIGWANFQAPNTLTLNVGSGDIFYARVYAQNITDAAGQGSGISAWIGYSTTNTDPSTWTEWVPATYINDQGNNDQYRAYLGNTLPVGTYYIASRFALSVTDGGPAYVYGGYSSGGGGFWNGTTYISGVLTIRLPIPSTPSLTTPVYNATGVSTLPTFTWTSVSYAETYRLQVATDQNFTNIIFDDSTLTATSKTLTSALENNRLYYWRVNAKNASGTSSYTGAYKFTTEAAIGWANLQHPSSTVINTGGSATFYSRVYAQNITEATGQGAGISAWIGYSTTNTNPNTWTNWVPATYNADQGNNDEYNAAIGSTLSAGTYYVASRFQLGSGSYVYGGYSIGGGGYWDGTNYISATLTISLQAPEAPTLVTPVNNATGVGTLPTLTWNASANATSYRLIISTKADFTDVVYNDSTITDTSKTLTSALLNNKQYYWKVNAKNGSGTSSYSTTWNFTTVAVIGWANLQFPGSASISVGGSATYYSRVYAQNITEPSGQGAGITAWIGYSTTNTNPNTWTNWVPATYNADQGNNDEYNAAIGSTLASGTYYVASRFQLGSTEIPANYVYGGYSTDGGGYWDGTTYVSATLSVAVPAPGAPTLVSPLNNTTGVSTLPTLVWNTSLNAVSYRLMVATDADFNNIVYNDSTLTDTSKTLTAALDNNRTYYWKVNAKNSSGTSGYSTVWNFKTVAVIGWANLQFPGSASIDLGGSATYYSRVYAQNLTEPSGQGAGISAWIGYSTTNTNPNTWTNWVPATYNADQGNNDEYNAAIGSTLASGTYYVASRFQLGSTEIPANYVYGGYSTDGGGIWDGTTYVSATLSVSVPAPNAPTLVSPLNNSTGISTLTTLTWNASTNATSYRLIIATNSDFTDVVYNDSTITDTSKTLTAALLNNKQYYWKVNAKNGSGTSSYSTTWNFTTVAVIGWANLQFPGSASIDLGGSATYYSRVYAQNITEPSGQGAGISAWIGYSTTNTNPNTWTNWVPATYNADQGNNDEYQAAIGSTLPSGTYYVASRFQLGSTETPANYVYGGYSTDGGGIWDGTTYVSATLSVAVPAPSAPTLVSPLNNSTGISTLPTLTWNASTNATSYRLIIATNSDFTDVVYNDSTITDTSKTLSAALQNNKQYYWKVNAKNGSGTSSYSTTWNFTTVAVIGWANLQWPPNANISSDSSVTVYTRIWVNGITDQPGAGPGILGWIGYSTTNSNPANWTNWIPAVYNVDAGNDDEYMAAIGNNLPAGTYYYASRFNLNSGEYKYGGYNEAGGGFWDSTNNVSGVLVVNSPLPTAPEQLLPLNNSYNQTLTLQFKWSSVPSAINYRLQVATDQGFANVIYNDSTLTDTTVTLSNVLLNSTIYYWRVRAKNISGNGPFSAIWNFKTISEIPIVSNLWQLNSGNGTLPGWFSTNNTERGIAFGSTNSKLESDDRLFVTSTNGGIFIRILNASNGAEVGSLNNTGITGGALPISDVETTADGKILVCNLTENASLSPFKIYLWNSETSVPSNIINWLSSDAVKLGDKFTVTGSYSDNSAVIYAASETNGINKLYKWTMSGGAFTNNPTIINLTGVEEVPAPSASVGPLPNGDFYWKASMMKLRKYTSTGSLIDTIPSAVVPLQGNAVRYVGKVNNKEYAVIFQYGNINENARIIEVSDNNYSQAISLETTPTLGMNPNIYGFGDVTVRINQNGSADIYVLSTNNGIGRYQTIQPIPVELSSFNAIANGDNVTLHWSTATESNSREFIIERMDGKDTEWKIIGKVDAKGSSVSQTDYSYKDEHLMEGIHEYRLKMVDVDGTFSYSQVINVETGNPTSYLLMQNYPNPFNPSTSISYQLSENSKVRLTIYDITGREIAILIDKQQDAGSYRIDFNASNLTSGIYFYELIAGDFRDVKKLVLMK